jgi:hypothetical protein
VYGGAFMYEKRIHQNTGAWGAQAKFELTGDYQRYIVGGVYKRWFEKKKILLLSELDLALQHFTYDGVGAAEATPRGQLAAHVSGTYFLTKGVMVGAALERFDQDLFLEESTRDAAVLNVQYFAYAHIELHLMGKLEFQGGKYSKPSQIALLMLHYYL